MASMYVLAFITPPMKNRGDYPTITFITQNKLNFKLDNVDQVYVIIAYILKLFTWGIQLNLE